VKISKNQTGTLNMTIQAFKDENAAAHTKYQVEREAWEKTVDPALLKAVNKRRAQSGKAKIVIHVKTGDKRPALPFNRYVLSSSDGIQRAVLILHSVTDAVFVGL
jgi:hypothetical protein